MIPQRYLELMHGEIDGVNTPAASGELQGYLEAHAEARAHFHDLKRTAAALAAMPDEQPPAYLRGRILTAIDELAAARRERPRPAAVRFPRLPGPRPALRYAVCGAAGLALGLVLALALSRPFSPRAPEDWAALHGALHGQWPDGAAGPTADVSAAGVTGGARVARLGGEWVAVQIDLEAEPALAPLAVEVGHPSAVSCGGVWGLSGVPAALSAEGGRVRFDHQGRSRYLVFFRDTGAARTSYDLALKRGGEMLVQRRLAPPSG